MGLGLKGNGFRGKEVKGEWGEGIEVLYRGS